MSNNSEREGAVLDKLVSISSRMFYESKFVVFLDAMIKLQYVRDYDLCGYLKVVTMKELNKIAERLRQDGLLSVDVRSEVREVDGKTIQATYYTLDYKRYIDVCKYRMYCIQKRINESTSQSLSGPGYICSGESCKKTFNSLDAPMLNFVCDNCGADIIKKNVMESVVDSDDLPSKTSSYHELQKKFNEQTLLLRQLLKETEEFSVQRSQAHRKKITADALRQREAKEEGTELTLKDRKTTTIPSTSSSIRDISNAVAEDNTRINITIQKDMKEVARQQEAEIEMKRQQNLRPDWFTHSTVSHEKIAKDYRDEQTATGAGSLQKKRAAADVPDQEQILEQLLSKEKKMKMMAEPGTTTENLADKANGDGGGGVDGGEEDGEDFEDEDDDDMVQVGGELVSIFDITDEHVKKMSAEEREASDTGIF